MADSKRRDRPKGSELRASLKPKKPVRPTVKAMEDALMASAPGVPLGAAASEATDPYLSRNEFKPGFYEQNAGKITPEGLYGTASGKKMFEADIVDPDTSMMLNRKKGGSVEIGKGKNYIKDLL